MLFSPVFAKQNFRRSTSLASAALRSPRFLHCVTSPTTVTPLFGTHTNHPQFTENTNTLSPAFATHTDFAAVSLVFATHTKTTGVYTNSSRFGARPSTLRFPARTFSGSLPILQPDALPSAAQIRRLDSHEASEHFLHAQQTQLHARGPAQSHAAAVRLCNVRLRDRRAFRPRGHGHHQRPGAHASLSIDPSFFLVHPRFARGCRTHHRDSRRGRLLPLGARGLRRLLGISGGLVELERVIPSRRRVRRVIHGLPYKLSFVLLHNSRLDALRHCRRGDCGDRAHQRARHPDGRRGRYHSGNFHSCADRRALRHRRYEVAAQSVYSADSAARAAVSGFWRGTRAGSVAVLRLRTGFERGRGSGTSSAELSDCSRDRRAAFDGDVFSAHHVFACGAGELAEVAHRIFFRSRAFDRRAVAGICDDHRGDDHQSFADECHRADQHAHAVHNGRGRLPAAGARRAASALRHTVDRYHRVLHYLRAAGAENDGAASDRLRVAANRRDHSDGSCVVAAAQDPAGFVAPFSHSLGPRRVALCHGRARGDERCRACGQRPVRAKVGTGCRPARTGDVFCVPQIAGRKNRQWPAGYVKKSRILYHAPARGSAQVFPLRRPIGATGNLTPSKGMSFGSPQISPASFAPNQVAAATPCPANPAAKYIPSIFPACGITSSVKSSVPPQTNSTFASRSFGYTLIIPRRRISALRRTVFSVSGKNAARPPKSMRLSGVRR